MRRRVYFNSKMVINYKYAIILVLIVSMVAWLHLFCVSLRPKVMMFAKNEVDQLTNIAISNCISKVIKDNVDSDILLFLNNNNNEIVVAEYRLNNLYNLLEMVSNELYTTLNQNNKVLFISLGMISNNLFLNNIGSNIPIKIDWIRNIFTNLRTKVTNYGLNNALVEIYITIAINQELVVPFEKKMEKKNYEVLISSYLINGKVPSVYGSGFEINSNEYVK